MINMINQALSIYKKERLINLSIIDNDGDALVSFFNKENWNVKLNFKMISSSWTSGSINPEKLLRQIVSGVLANFGIEVKDYNKTKYFNSSDIVENFELDDYLNKKLVEINNCSGNIIFIQGVAKTGKTKLSKYYCHNKHHDGSISIYLDFNGGAIDFTEALIYIITSRRKSIYIILDNLECCNMVYAKKIYAFFKELVENLCNLHQFAQLIITQTPQKQIDDPTCYEFCELSLIDNYKSSNELGKIINYEKLFDQTHENLILKILLVSSYGFIVILNEEEYFSIMEIIDKDIIKGIKIANIDDHYQVTLWDRTICCKLLQDFINNCKRFRFLNDLKKKEIIKKIISDYYKNTNILSLTSISEFLKNNLYIYKQQENKNVFNLQELIYLATKNVSKIKEEVMEYSKHNNMLYGNHLGAIVFAAEALSYYSDDWNILEAWQMIAKYIRETYYIGGQRYPEIVLDKENIEHTYEDFYNGENFSSIKTQMQIQDDIISKCSFNDQYNEITLYSKDKFLKTDFSYVLSTFQNESCSDIDIRRFYCTYIMALLFEFESSAPKGQRDKTRINDLYKKIKANIIKEENGAAYFYPKRVPWVTARMLLALCSYDKTDANIYEMDIYNEITQYKKCLQKWLEKCNLCIKVDNENYRIWTAGTGKWNSVLDTTMMCTFALIKSGGNSSIIDEGINYILLCKNDWFSADMLADGIWACETLWQRDNVNSERLFTKLSELKENLDILLSTNGKFKTQNDKSDRSLGSTHVVKTLVSLISSITNQRPQILPDYEEIFNIENTCKLFISYYTNTGKTVAETIHKELNGSNYLPYMYQKDMLAGIWSKRLEYAIQQANYCLLVITKETFTSEYVLDEIRIMLENNKIILPIIDSTINIEREIENINPSILSEYLKNKLILGIKGGKNGGWNHVLYNENGIKETIENIKKYCRIT